MRHLPNEVFRSFRSILVVMSLTVLLTLSSLTAIACGTTADSSTTVTTTGAESTLTTDATSDATVTIRDTGITTTSTLAVSVPALAPGIMPEQALELVAAKSHVAPGNWEFRGCETLGNWAVANLYTGMLSEQMDERGVAAVFEKRDGAWFQAGWISISDLSEQQAIELYNMGAPEEVWIYFGLERRSAAESFPPEQMPEDFGFVAAYGVMGRNVVDTFAGTFTKDLGPNEEPVTTELVLSAVDLETLYHDLILIQNQWQMFTEGFDPDPDQSNTGTTIHVTPSQTYTLKWSAGGFDAQAVAWNDDALSTDLQAVALRDWFERLRMLIEAAPEWKALPPMSGGYA